jgi:hypothetical protein
MSDVDSMPIVFILAVMVSIGWAIWKSFFKKCKECGGRFKLDSHKDSMGHTVSKNITISFWKGPRRYTEVWKCQSCDYQEVKKHWSLD